MALGLKLTEIGQEEVIQTDYYIGVSNITGITELIVGEAAGLRYVSKLFRYSKDGVSWSEFIVINDFNLQSIGDLKPNHLFAIEYKYKRLGSDPGGEIIISNISLHFNYTPLVIPEKYLNSYLYKKRNFITAESINRTLNLIVKLYSKDIVATFIERGDNVNWSDEDYLDFWFSLVHYYSVFIDFARDFENISFNKDTLQEYLLSKGLFLEQNRALDRLLYLQENLYNEYRIRGTSQITDKKFNTELYKGEFLRLISQKDKEEYIFSKVESGKSGWCIDHSSPEYNNLSNVKNCNKSWESVETLENMFSYPLIGVTNLTQTVSTYNESKCIKIKPNPSVRSGIGTNENDPEIDKLIIIDPRLDYEITFTIEVGDSINWYNSEMELSELNFGCHAFDSSYRKLWLLKINDLTTQSNHFIPETENPKILRGIPLVIRGIVFNKNISNTSNTTLTAGYGNHLKFSGNIVKYICPFITIGSSAANATYIYGVKIKPLRSTNSRCFIGMNNDSIMWINNSSGIDKKYIKENSNDKLLPYSLINNMIFLDEYHYDLPNV